MESRQSNYFGWAGKEVGPLADSIMIVPTKKHSNMIFITGLHEFILPTTPGLRQRFRSGGHSQRREHFPAGVRAFRASVRADAAMFVFFRMAAAFRGTGAAESDAGRELSFQRLPISCLICTRDHAAGGGANRRAIEIEADASDQGFDVFLGKAGVGAGGACLEAKRAGVDAGADSIRMGRMLRM